MVSLSYTINNEHIYGDSLSVHMLLLEDSQGWMKGVWMDSFEKHMLEVQESI